MGLDCCTPAGGSSSTTFNGAKILATAFATTGGGTEDAVQFDTLFYDTGAPKFWRPASFVDRLLFPSRSYYMVGASIDLGPAAIVSGWVSIRLELDGFPFAWDARKLLAGSEGNTRLTVTEPALALAGSNLRAYISQQATGNVGLSVDIRMWAHEIFKE